MMTHSKYCKINRTQVMMKILLKKIKGLIIDLKIPKTISGQNLLKPYMEINKDKEKCPNLVDNNNNRCYILQDIPQKECLKRKSL